MNSYQCYSLKVHEVGDDILYKYKGVYINLNYFSNNLIEDYAGKIPAFGVGLVARVASDRHLWGVIFRSEPICSESLPKKVRNELRRYARSFDVQIESKDSLDLESIRRCYSGAASRGGFKKNESELRAYISNVECHLESPFSYVISVRSQADQTVVLGVALVNALPALKIINIKNVKIDYCYPDIDGAGVYLSYWICNHFSRHLASGWRIHAGTTSLRHGDGFQEGVLRKKLGFMREGVEPVIIAKGPIRFALTPILTMVNRHCSGITAKMGRLTIYR